MTSEPNDTSRSKVLRPDWKHFFWRYIASVLLIPAFGVGIPLIWWVRRIHKQFSYHITDTNIEVKDRTYSERVDLENINQVSVHQRWIDKKFGIGTLTLHTDGRTVELLGQSNPESLADMIKKAVAYRQKQLEEEARSKPDREMPTAGEMERVNYLTGLWQQGLITDEEYERQRGSH